MLAIVSLLVKGYDLEIESLLVTVFVIWIYSLKLVYFFRAVDGIDSFGVTVLFVPQALLERGFSSLMDSQRLSELKLMYQLFQRVQKLDEARL